MKMKKLIPVLALLMGLTAFSGCTGTDQKIMFEPFWNEHSNADKETINETLTYDVKFIEPTNSPFVDYKLAYKDGVYTTHLVGEVVSGELLYTYSTELSIVALFTLGEEVKEFTDTVTSEVKFKAVNYGLQPISSKKEINCHSPLYNADEPYQHYHYTLETNYLDACTKGKTVITNHLADTNAKPTTNEFNIDQEKFSYLDNEQLLAALRCIRSTTTSAKVNVYSPFVDTVQKVSVTFSEDKSEEYTFSINGAEAKKEVVTCRPVSIVLDERNPGDTQTAMFAKFEEVNGSSKYRNVMMSLKTPLSYGLGTLEYTLRSMEHTK